MLNFAKYFFRGVKNTLRFQNGVNLAHKGPWVTVTADTIVDEFFVGDFCAAEYTIVVDVGNFRKEVVKALVVAGPNTASVNLYGRTNLGENLVDLTATVSDSRVRIVAHPSSSPDGSTYDNSSLLLGAKLIFSATYYHTINDLVRS